MAPAAKSGCQSLPQELPSVRAEAASVPAAPKRPSMVLAFKPCSFIKHLLRGRQCAKSWATGVPQEGDYRREGSPGGIRTEAVRCLEAVGL